MVRLRWIAVCCALGLGLVACDRPRPKKPDLTLGRISGIVLCADTGKPARFAEVTLTAAPTTNEAFEQTTPLSDSETAMTDLDGRFVMEAVKPGRYFAFASQEGYLDPARGLDLNRLEKLANDHERALDALKQWKAYMVEVPVAAHRTTGVTITIEPAAEIEGTVTYDDGSPAIGMHFELFRKTIDNNWTNVGLGRMDGWTLQEVSDRRGRYRLENLIGGEYIVCALIPSGWEDEAPRVCTGNVFRKQDARTVHVPSTGVQQGADIVIPLTGMHSISGTVTAVLDGHPLTTGKVQLLYADDRALARETDMDVDGYFVFRYVPNGEYILQVTEVSETDSESVEDPETHKKREIHYADKETALNVVTDMQSVNFALLQIPSTKIEGKH